ncbi:hypothetical protein E2C01_032668 [Portunus trituberculatus]|uniref:Uncharacterized protein n=1 Tax=Portunus trituberculatus TaxID=210409 RepID=A0A5B7F1B9_PORTR|nr:hypothetical protein [Portunus trituberculatus]
MCLRGCVCEREVVYVFHCLFDLLQSLTRQPDVTLRSELKAHYFRSLNSVCV